MGSTTASTGRYDVFHDLDGSGGINIVDVIIARNEVGSALPGGGGASISTLVFSDTEQVAPSAGLAPALSTYEATEIDLEASPTATDLDWRVRTLVNEQPETGRHTGRQPWEVAFSYSSGDRSLWAAAARAWELREASGQRGLFDRATERMGRSWTDWLEVDDDDEDEDGFAYAVEEIVLEDQVTVDAEPTLGTPRTRNLRSNLEARRDGDTR